MPEEKRFGGLLRYRQCLVPTLRGCLLVLLVCAVLGITAFRHLHSFLALNDPLPGGALVVEGWATDYTIGEAVAEFKHGQYDTFYVTGGAIEWGAPLSEYKNYAQRGAAVALRLGLSSNVLQEVTAPKVQQDRTFTAATALKNWAREHGITITRIHLFTEGPHARRSRLLFEKAFKGKVSVGVTAVCARDYDPRHWWRSSSGFRAVADELIAYVYARFLFRAPKEPLKTPVAWVQTRFQG
jgi:uncharacterized SAM-binding protein YcdF (DUF218 family)